MRLYLFRHGPATSLRPGHPDAERPLTREGHALMEAALQGLAGQLPAPDLVLTSPYRRALQTAKLVASAWGVSLQTVPGLASGAGFRAYAAAWDEAGRPARWAAVGHQPEVSAVVERLTGAQVAFTPGTLAILENHRMRPGTGHLVALVPPELPAASGP